MCWIYHNNIKIQNDHISHSIVNCNTISLYEALKQIFSPYIVFPRSYQAHNPLDFTYDYFCVLVLDTYYIIYLFPVSNESKNHLYFQFCVQKSLNYIFSSNTDFLPSYEKWNIRKRYEVLSQNQGRKKWFRSHSTLATIVEMSSLRCNISITMDHHSYSLPSGSCKHPRLKDVLSLQKTEMNLPMAKSLLEIPNGVKLKGMSKVKSDNNQPNYNILIWYHILNQCCFSWSYIISTLLQRWRRYDR